MCGCNTEPRDEWTPIPDGLPLIVDPAKFADVQKMWDRPVSGIPTKHHDYPLTGIIGCSSCGSSMGGASKRNGEDHLYCYYGCSGTTANAKRDAICKATQVPAIRLEEVIWAHLEAALRDPSAIIADLRKHWQTGSGKIGQRIVRLRRDVQKVRSEKMNLVRQHARGVIDQQMLDELVGPVNLLLDKHEKNLGVLEEQRRLQDAADEVEKRIRAAFARYAAHLDEVTSEAKVALMSRLNVKVVASTERALVTAEIDPSVFTIEHTLA